MKFIYYLFYNLKDRLFKLSMPKKWKSHYGGITDFAEISTYSGYPMLKTKDVHRLIQELIDNERPIMIARFGTVELSAMKVFHFNLNRIKQNIMGNLCIQAGFFPKDVNSGGGCELMLKNIGEIDVHLTQCIRCEDYFIKKFMNIKGLSHINNLNPWTNPKDPWTKALKGKRVLVIHPFEETIKTQYKKREKLFPNSNILPDFKLITIKAVQTIADQTDERFANWFEALEWMYNQTLTIDYDIALIGCGAYGLPLAAKIKKSGKHAIHMGGMLQGLFGIKCKRFDEAPDYENLRCWYNENWIYPLDADMPNGFNKVEGGCYWKPIELT